MAAFGSVDHLMRDAVTTWFGAFVLENQRVVASYPYPADRGVLLDRLRSRREGRLTPEESRMLTEHLEQGLRSRDRRLVTAGAKAGRFEAPELDPSAYGINPSWLREILLEDAKESLRLAWDPSVHVEEAVRALRDLDAVRNLLGERLTSWAGRDAPPSEGDLTGSAEAVARRLTRPGTEEGAPSAGPESPLEHARRGLAELYLGLGGSSKAIEKALEERLPLEAPNVSALLGPLLAARMIAQAGGLDRLARLPASTIQVLGAERAFFEHLRGHAPPPRHGLLFLHPDIQSAPRNSRGKLARALAGKVAIAARLDREGKPVRADLVAAFKHRTEEVRAMGPGRGAASKGRKRSVPPLHRAAQNR
jgi:nucleolar protein 56